MKKFLKGEIIENRVRRKEYKKSLQKKKRLKKLITHCILFFIIEVLFISIFLIINLDYAEATTENTEKIVCKIDKIHRAGAGRNSPYVFVSNEREFVFFNPGNSAHKFHDEIISQESVTLTVKKRATLLGHHDIVDIRTKKFVYYDISTANEFYKDNRTFSTLWAGFFCFAYTLIHVLIIIFDIHAYHTKKHFG